MKKALALVMAIAMIASLAVVSMAAGTTQLGTTVNTTKPVYKVKPFATKLAVHNGTNYVDLAADDNVVFGDTVYAILIDEDGALATSDAVKGLTVDAKWTQNGDYVKGVELVKYKNVYAVAIATQGSSQTEVQVVGELALKGKSYYEVANEGAKETINYKTGIEILLAYETEDVTGDTVAPTDLVLYNFGHASTPAKVTVDFDEIQVSADTKGMKKVLFAYNNDVNEDLFDAYLDADLTIAQLADDALQLLGRKGDGTSLFHDAGHLGYDGQLHAGGGKLQFAIGSFQQYVGENGHAGTGGYHAGYFVDAIKQNLFCE